MKKAEWFINDFLKLNTVPSSFIHEIYKLRNDLFHRGNIENYRELNNKRYYLKNILERFFLGLVNYKNDYFYSPWDTWSAQNFTKLKS